MDTLWVLAAVLAVVSGDVGLGYQYKVPQTSYGVPSYQFGESGSHHGLSSLGSSTGFNYKGYSSQGGYIGSTVSPTPAAGFISQTTLSGSEQHSGRGQISGSGLSGLYYPVNTESKGHYYYPSNVNVASGTKNLVSPFYTSFVGDASHTVSPSYNEYQNQYLRTAANKYQQYYVQQQPAQVYKHYFVHTAPEESEVPQPRKSIVLPPPQKHYKIIFVKTPTDTRTPQVIPVPQQHEEKTIVYVLSKKQDQPQDILVPKIENKPPTKPEVYFVKYKNKEDSQAVIDGIVNDYNKGQGQTVTFSGLDSSPTDTFGSGSSGSFASSGSHGTVGSYPIYSTGSHGVPSSFSEGQYAEHISYSPLNVHGPVSDFVTETYNINKVSSSPETFTVGTVDPSIAGLSETSTIYGGLLHGNNVVSTTASSLVHDDSHVISTSQGLPHESYGPPKFRTV